MAEVHYYVESIAPFLSKVYLAVRQNLSLWKHDWMIPQMTPHIIRNIRYDGAKVRLCTMIWDIESGFVLKSAPLALLSRSSRLVICSATLCSLSRLLCSLHSPVCLFVGKFDIIVQRWAPRCNSDHSANRGKNEKMGMTSAPHNLAFSQSIVDILKCII